ncbi:uncharacterized protein LOC111265434 isoform X1 [Varroa jacobsoni]|uniref:uncharacterized protein LOC111265434 isoform X1 n=1 Tax=Varroa jacobsoni TaxID=62625 RepID=UPI000BF44FAD|nr:uncharacterized protein LOC111265434 isoform X1 [Varroa jacobsoni]
MFRRKFLLWLLVATLTFEAIYVQAKPKQNSWQLWLPSMADIVSRLPSLTTIAAQLPSLSSLSPIQTFFSPGSGASIFGPALADFGSYISGTMPAFSDVYTSIPSWEDWNGLLPNIPRPSSIYGQLPQEIQSSLQQMWAQMNPLDVETFRRRQYQRGAMLMLGLAGFYSNYQRRYKQYRKGIEQYVEPHERKQKYTEMKRVCYYSLPQRKHGNDSLAPANIKSGLCTHLMLNDATVSAESGAVSFSYDETDDGFLQDMIGKLKDASPKILLCVGGRGPENAVVQDTTNAFQHMAHSKKKRLKFIRSSMGLVRRYGLAGVDIDWRSGAGGSHLADFFEEFRGYMEPWGNDAKNDGDKAAPLKDILLTATVQAMPWASFAPNDVRRLAKHADWINVRAFDDSSQHVATPQYGAPLFKLRDGRQRNPNAAHSVMAWTVRGIPHHKLVLGVPLFGRSYHVMPQPGFEHAVPATLRFSHDFHFVGKPDLTKQTRLTGGEFGGNFLRRKDPPYLATMVSFSNLNTAKNSKSVSKGHGRVDKRQFFAEKTRNEADFKVKANTPPIERTVRAGIEHENIGPYVQVHSERDCLSTLCSGTGTAQGKADLNKILHRSNHIYTPRFNQEANGKDVNGSFREKAAIVQHDLKMGIPLSLQPPNAVQRSSSSDRSYIYRNLNTLKRTTDREPIALKGDQYPALTMARSRDPIKNVVTPAKAASFPVQMPNYLPMKVSNIKDQYSFLTTEVATHNGEVVFFLDRGQLSKGEILKTTINPYRSVLASAKVADEKEPNTQRTFDNYILTRSETTINELTNKGVGDRGVMTVAKTIKDSVNAVRPSEAKEMIGNVSDELSESLKRDLVGNMMVKDQHLRNDGTTTEKVSDTQILMGIEPPDNKNVIFNEAMTNVIMAPQHISTLQTELDNHGIVPYAQICRMIGDRSAFQLIRDNSSHASIASNGVHWIYFDDQRDVAAKARWSEDMGLGGIALFSLNEDDWEGNCDPNGTPFRIARTVWKIIG